MKITKPKDNQLLFEDENLKHFQLEVKSKTGLNNTEYNNFYDGVILAYRQPNMDASKQLFLGSTITICTLICSCIENLLTHGVLNENLLDEMVKNVKETARKRER